MKKTIKCTFCIAMFCRVDCTFLGGSSRVIHNSMIFGLRFSPVGVASTKTRLKAVERVLYKQHLFLVAHGWSMALVCEKKRLSCRQGDLRGLLGWQIETPHQCVVSSGFYLILSLCQLVPFLGLARVLPLSSLVSLMAMVDLTVQNTWFGAWDGRNEITLEGTKLYLTL